MVMNKREELIFSAALQLPLAERTAFVDEACGSEPGLSQRLKNLLEGFEQAGGFLEEPAGSVGLAAKALREGQLSFMETAP